MKYLFYLDELEFYGGKAEPVSWDCDLKRGCVATYKMCIGFRSCNAKVYVSKKGTRKVLAMGDNETDPGGGNAVYDTFEQRMSQDGDILSTPEYVHSIAFKRGMAKFLWRICCILCMLIGVFMIMATCLFGIGNSYVIIAAIVCLLGLVGFVRTDVVEDMFAGGNADYQKIALLRL